MNARRWKWTWDPGPLQLVVGIDDEQAARRLLFLAGVDIVWADKRYVGKDRAGDIKFTVERA